MLLWDILYTVLCTVSCWGASVLGPRPDTPTPQGGQRKCTGTLGKCRELWLGGLLHLGPAWFTVEQHHGEGRGNTDCRMYTGFHAPVVEAWSCRDPKTFQTITGWEAGDLFSVVIYHMV